MFDEALECADRAVLFKAGTKEIAARFGIVPSFMAKWNSELPGTSGHIHVSLWKDGKNLFHDDADPDRMSGDFRAYVQGFLDALPEVLPFFAPNINSYKRLVDGYWAPTKASWGVDNRTVAARVIPGSSEVHSRRDPDRRRRRESVSRHGRGHRLGSAGRRTQKLQPAQYDARTRPAPTPTTSIPRLPRTLDQATERPCRIGDLAKELFGEPSSSITSCGRGAGKSSQALGVGHRLGTQTLLRNHLTSRAPSMSILHRFSFPTTIHFGAGARSLVPAHLAAQGLKKRPLVVTDQGVEKLPFFAELVQSPEAQPVSSPPCSAGSSATRSNRKSLLVLPFSSRTTAD